MTRWKFIFAGVIVLFLVGSYLMLHTTHDDGPRRPSNLPQEAFWAGGMDGGAWFVINPKQPAIDVWEIKIYSDDGRPWVRGNFWSNRSAEANSFPSISGFDGNTIHLRDGKMMLPVGEHFYRPIGGGDTKVINYPQPGADYTEPKPIAERLDKPESW